ncbi:MAG: flavin reductase family protein [Acidobacteria bacterium]|jgi:flavin reductase (DIM6/NTAB) family NADH-FMN oxidoreductase RutF|nr:MAG: flavin reductase family protein [Acidobacteriota bacterium]
MDSRLIKSATLHALPPPERELSSPQEAFKTLENAYFLGYVPRPVVLICVGENPLAVAWHMPTNKDPFMYAVAISKENYSYKLVVEGSNFTVNFLPKDHLEDILIAGRVHGDKENKWELFKELKPIKALKVRALMVEQSLLVYECTQYRSVELPDHTLLIGRVELIHYKRGKLKPHKIRYPLHMGKGYFSTNCRLLKVNL